MHWNRFVGCQKFSRLGGTIGIVILNHPSFYLYWLKVGKQILFMLVGRISHNFSRHDFHKTIYFRTHCSYPHALILSEKVKLFPIPLVQPMFSFFPQFSPLLYAWAYVCVCLVRAKLIKLVDTWIFDRPDPQKLPASPSERPIHASTEWWCSQLGTRIKPKSHKSSWIFAGWIEISHFGGGVILNAPVKSFSARIITPSYGSQV